ncbi:DinB family protein [Zhouia spongiae]|uniref:DinB family protein n=1 Tax=Zhouia spongiae TaxID=2202721 RepID=A0ABY3YPF5_9FLAO|nr:DinB family protein [Zhouia spongiae]UNY99467.1 DinB family protein [Zhouia spongiae]
MEWTFDITTKNRAIFKNLLESTSLEDLNKIPEGFNNNIFWNIAHVVVTQQLLAYKLSGLEMNVSDEMIEAYRKGTKPVRDVTREEVDQLIELLFSTLDQLQQDYNENKFQQYQQYTVQTNGSTLSNIEEALEFNNFHEGIHMGYVLAQKRALSSV